MKTIIAGSRSITDYDALLSAISQAVWDITEEYQTWFSRDVNALNRDWDVIQQEYVDVLKR